jgi:hypothetical protein
LNSAILGIHCLAHRAQLSLKDAHDNTAYVRNKFLPTVEALHNFYVNSPVRAAGLAAIQDDLGADRLRMVALQKTRWLSLVRCCTTIRRSIVPVFQHLATVKQSGNVDNGLTAATGNYKFVRTLLMMCDVLQVMADLSLCFQRSELDFTAIYRDVKIAKEALEALKEIAGDHESKVDEVLKSLADADIKVSSSDKQLTDAASARKQFIQALLDNLPVRFEQLDIFNSLGRLLDPVHMPAVLESPLVSPALERDLTVVIGHFKSSFATDADKKTAKERKVRAEEKKAGCEAKEVKEPGEAVVDSNKLYEFDFACLRDEYPSVRRFLIHTSAEHNKQQLLLADPAQRRAMTMRHALQLYLSNSRSLETPNVVRLMHYVLALPVTTVECERGFSVMNLVKTDLRNRLSTKTLDALMRVRIESPPRKDVKWSRVLALWFAARPRHVRLGLDASAS